MTTNARQEKEIFLAFLRKIYGKVETQRSFKAELPDCIRPDEFKGRPFCENLNQIWGSLTKYRGYSELVGVKTKRLPGCDYYIPEQSRIIEFDERQHFSVPRKISLLMYPEGVELGFDRLRYISLCEEIKAVDNDKKVPHRDEQRAWLDTLRDFLPLIYGLKPIIRIYSRDFNWRMLNPDDPVHIEEVKRLLAQRCTA